MEEKNKVLIVTYYWPPSGGSGVQRWLKFVKYLPGFGWKPYIFTPENPSFAIRDESLQKDVPDEAEVVRFPIWEPYDFFFRLSRIFGERQSANPAKIVSSKKTSFFQSVSTWIRGNLFIPDPRIFWVGPSARFLHKFLADHKISTLITTGPPHSLHLIGLKLKKKNPSLQWIADFRDPWSEWGLLDSLRVGAFARQKHKRLEASVLTAADKVITITPFYVRQFEALGNRKVHLLTNGFDEDDFSNVVPVRTEKFIIRHIGIINEKCNPRPFMEAVLQLSQQETDFAKCVSMEFIGEVHPLFRKFVSDSDFLNRVTIFTGNIPHKDLVALYGASSLLLLILTGYKDAEGYMPGKLFEYLATGVPVLGVGPVNGDAARMLQETHTGKMIDSFDAGGIQQALLRYFKEWLSASGSMEKKNASLGYSRKAITGRLSQLLSS